MSNQKKRGLIFVVSGPSGSGKTTLLEKLLKDRELRGRLVKSVSFATRPRRSGEKDKKDYFFITEALFKKMRKQKKILEWTRYLGYYYATPKDFVEKELARGRHIILCLDIRGALRIKKLYPKNTVTIFILPPSVEILQERIKGRCRRTRMEEIKQRLELAQEEFLASHKYDYSIVNKNLQDAVRELRGIVLKEICSKTTER